MKTKQEIITAMCFTFRHDYGLPKENYRIEGTHNHACYYRDWETDQIGRAHV